MAFLYSESRLREFVCIIKVTNYWSQSLKLRRRVKTVINFQSHFLMFILELIELFSDLLYVWADLERGSQLDGHGGHEMVGLQQHQGLPVDLLLGKVLDVLTAARQVLDEITNLCHIPLEGVAPETGEEGLGGGRGRGGDWRGRDNLLHSLLRLQLLLWGLEAVGLDGLVWLCWSRRPAWTPLDLSAWSSA